MIDDTGYNENAQNAEMNTIEHDTDDDQIQGLGQMSQHSSYSNETPLTGKGKAQQYQRRGKGDKRPTTKQDDDEELNLF